MPTQTFVYDPVDQPKMQRVEFTTPFTKAKVMPQVLIKVKELLCRFDTPAQLAEAVADRDRYYRQAALSSPAWDARFDILMVDAEGYVCTSQHDAERRPFPVAVYALRPSHETLIPFLRSLSAKGKATP